MPTIGDYETHPIADAFPMLMGIEYERFRDDVKEGLRERDIFLYQDKLLDGRNRYTACLELGKAHLNKLRFVEFKGDPFSFVISRNIISRRHLNESQRAIVACRLADMKPGRPKGGKVAGLTQSAAATALGVGDRTVRDARTVLDKGIPELVAAVDRGDITVNAALAIAELDPARQLELLQKVLTGGTNRRARSNIVRQSTKRSDAASDAAMVLTRAIMRATTHIGGTVDLGDTVASKEGTTERTSLIVGFQGRELAVTIALVPGDPEYS